MAKRKKAKTKGKKKKKKTAARKTARKKVVRKPARKKSSAKKKTAAKARKPALAGKPAPKPAPAAPRPASMARPAPAPKPAAPPAQAVPAGEERVGVVTHYFTHLSVAIVQLETGTLRQGDTVRIKGHTSDFKQPIDSMEVEHVHVNEVRAGQSFGLRVKEHAREHDVVYKVTRR